MLVIDGQGGGLGKAIVEQLKRVMPGQSVLALGTNALATSAMLRAGANMGATGENAICFNCRDADIILGAAGILMANAMLGEISPAIAAAVGASPAQKILLPSDRCGLTIVGVKARPMDESIAEAAAIAARMTDRSAGSGA